MSQPPVKVTALVDARDDYRCIRCGMSLYVTDGSRHHRMRRRDGGHRASNLILLCGSGTTGCHGWAHNHPEAARAEGIIVPANGRALPELIPVLTWWLFSRVWMMLHDSGDRDLISEAEAATALAEYGVIEASGGAS